MLVVVCNIWEEFTLSMFETPSTGKLSHIFSKQYPRTTNSLSLSPLSYTLRHLDFMITEVRKVTPMKKKQRRRIEVSFGRGSLLLPGYTCFTCLKSLFTHGTTIVTTTVIMG